MTAPDDCWLTATWLLVSSELPPPPGRVVEIGCGDVGGLVPALSDRGYQATGIDPQAPEGPAYRQARFEEVEVTGPVDAVVASTSLHHVHDLGLVLDRARRLLAPGGTIVVLEWGWERFDEPTARWCFDRLAETQPANDEHEDEDDEHERAHSTHETWLHHHFERWRRSGQPWDQYFRGWVDEEGLHPADGIVQALEERFTRVRLDDMPYFFCDLADTTRAHEQAAIDAGEIRASGLRYVGRV